MTFRISRTPRLTKGYAALGLLLALTGCSEPEPCRPMSVATVRLGGHVYAVPPEFNANFAGSQVETRVSVEGGPEDAQVGGEWARRIGRYCSRSPDPTPVVQTISTVDGQRQLPERFAPLRAATYLALEEIPAGRQWVAQTSGAPWRDGLVRADNPKTFEFAGQSLGKWKRPLGATCTKSISPDVGPPHCRVGTTSTAGAQLTLDIKLHSDDDLSKLPGILRAADELFESFRKD